MAIVFAAGETVRAGKLNRLQPVCFRAVGSGTVAGGSTEAAITGCSITFSTQAANAIALINGHFSVDLGGATTGLMQGRCFVDGAIISTMARFSGEVATEECTVSQNWRQTLTTVGSHTIDLRATTGTNVTLTGAYCTIDVTIYEQA